MRIGVAIIIIIDLIIRALSIIAFFTNDGILPVDVLKTYNWNPYYFSFHALSGNLGWQICLFILNTLCAMFLLLGFRTRLFTFICWCFLVSLQIRNPFILQGGDDLLRLILFWGLFLPWGQRYSYDHCYNAKQLKNGTVAKMNEHHAYFSVANVGYMFLIASVYFFSALLKTSSEWHTDGTALYYALSLDQMRLPFGTLIYQFPWLLTSLTHIIYYIELLAPILIICPFITHKLRLLGVVLIILLHLGISVSLYVGLFYIIGIVTTFGLMPEKVMDYFELKFLKKINYNHNIITKKIDYKENYVIQIAETCKTWFILLVISFCLMINLGNVKWFPFVLESYLLKFGTAFRLDQSWGMFSPSVLKDDGWFIYSGFSERKKHCIDIKNNSDTLSFIKPETIVSDYESDRWRKYGENYLFNNNNHIRPYFCSYLLRKWNIEHPENKISEVTILFMKEVSLPNYGIKPVEKMVLCNCNEKE